MKDLLIKMASIANELDLIGLEKEVNQVTETMLKMSQQTPKDINQRVQAGFDVNQIADFKRILKNNPGLTDSQYYLMAKGLYAKDQSTTNFANSFMAYKRDPGAYPEGRNLGYGSQNEQTRGFGSQNEGFMPAGGGKFKDGGTFETKTGPSKLPQGPPPSPLEVNPLGNNNIFSPKPRKGLTSYP